MITASSSYCWQLPCQEKRPTASCCSWHVPDLLCLLLLDWPLQHPAARHLQLQELNLHQPLPLPPPLAAAAAAAVFGLLAAWVLSCHQQQERQRQQQPVCPSVLKHLNMYSNHMAEP
jgi:hypothetical protein